MIRIYFSILVLATSFFPCFGLHGEEKAKKDFDPEEELKKGSEDYQFTIMQAKERMLAGFEDQEKKLEANTKLKVAEQIKLIEQLQSEKKAFQSDQNKLPKSTSMKQYLNDYQNKISSARKKYELLFDKVAEYYRNKKEFLKAKELLIKKENFIKNSALPKERSATQIVGSWNWSEHKMIFEKGGRVIEYLPNGKLNARGKWLTLEDGAIEIVLDNGWKMQVQFSEINQLQAISYGPKGQKLKATVYKLYN